MMKMILAYDIDLQAPVLINPDYIVSIKPEGDGKYEQKFCIVTPNEVFRIAVVTELLDNTSQESKLQSFAELMAIFDKEE